MNSPLVSVLIPSYNHAKYITECIKSIIDQDYENIELIVIDDGSHDASIEKIKSLANECRERFVRFEFISRENRGLCSTLNECIEWSNGYLINPIASDDILLPKKISTQVSEFTKLRNQHPRLVAMYSGVEFIDCDGNPTNVKKGSGRISTFNEVFMRTEFLPTPTFLALREKVVSVGKFNSNYKIEDFYIRLKLTEDGSVFYCIPEPLVRYRRHDDNLSKKSDLIWHGVKEILSEYRSRPGYSKAMGMSMMIQAHDYQAVNNRKGVAFALSAIATYPGVLLTKSALKFFIKLFYKPKHHR